MYNKLKISDIVITVQNNHSVIYIFDTSKLCFVLL